MLTVPQEYEALTVGELKNELDRFPDDFPVITEGCDCLGKAFTLEEYTRCYPPAIGKVVLIRRPPDLS